MEKPNRAERRKQKFGVGRSTEHGGWPSHLPNPVFSEVPAPDAASPAPVVEPSGDAPATTAEETQDSKGTKPA